MSTTEFSLRLTEYGVAMAHRQGERAKVLADVLVSMYQQQATDDSCPNGISEGDQEIAPLMEVMPSTLEKWQSLYRRMRNVAAGYSNLADESGTSRRLDREYEAIDDEARLLPRSAA